jgi:glycosyltransferase involved in cell wall biosynthesis
MRITFVTRRYWPAIGGVERVAMSLGECLCRQGHEVKVVAQCVDEGPFGRMTHIIRENKRFARFVRNGVEVVQFRPSRPRRAALMPLGLELIPFAGRISNRWMRRYTSLYYAAVVESTLTSLLADADIVHVLGGEVMAVAAVRSARRLGKPVAVTPFAHPGEWGLDSGSIRAYREADLVIATTRADADVYRGIGVESDRLEIVPLPVPALTREQVAQAPMDGGSSELADAPLVVFLGARRPTKGVEILLEAAPLVWRTHPQARFAFVGPGAPLAQEDQRLIDVGPVSDAERTLWLARANLLCLPSISESFGLVVSEAWSQSTPVVVSDIPVLRELVESSGGGLLAQRDAPAMAAAIGSLLDDPQRARTMGAAGREYWRQSLEPDAVAARHVAIYRAISPQPH